MHGKSRAVAERLDIIEPTHGGNGQRRQDRPSNPQQFLRSQYRDHQGHRDDDRDNRQPTPRGVVRVWLLRELGVSMMP